MATRSKTKTAYRHEHADKRPHATARYIRIATRKCTIVADLIRGKSVKEAQAILTYCPKAAAGIGPHLSQTKPFVVQKGP